MSVETRETKSSEESRSIASRGGFYGSRAYIENRDSAPEAVVRVEFYKDIDGIGTGYEYLDVNQYIQIPDFDMIACSVGYRDRPPVQAVIWNDSINAELWIFKEMAGTRQYIDYLPPVDAQGAFSYRFQISPGEEYRFLAVAPLKK
ncbi:hypothetical protein CSA56_08385 [candidate division KSB3 bacterium]|uniref:Uncharacterized protein n=1 Tax=candidate division KSB3 bacterium TaxID=2044937 RepID=A0A2G6KEP5_9BACT|nr:MAG: hypothetical protein CSA56_08385 [candidate division KSB3 bacterium]